MKLTAMTVAELVSLLRKFGCKNVSIESIESDVAVGAPAAVDGTINVIEYTAWMVRERGV